MRCFLPKLAALVIMTNAAGKFARRASFVPWLVPLLYIGQANQLETLVEYRVEMVCADGDIHAVMRALRLAHPY